MQHYTRDVLVALLRHLQKSGDDVNVAKLWNTGTIDNKAIPDHGEKILTVTVRMGEGGGVVKQGISGNDDTGHCPDIASPHIYHERLAFAY